MWNCSHTQNIYKFPSLLTLQGWKESIPIWYFFIPVSKHFPSLSVSEEMPQNSQPSAPHPITSLSTINTKPKTTKASDIYTPFHNVGSKYNRNRNCSNSDYLWQKCEVGKPMAPLQWLYFPKTWTVCSYCTLVGNKKASPVNLDDTKSETESSSFWVSS